MIEAVLLGDAPGALTRLCGVPMIERNLRVLRRLGFTSVSIVNATAAVREALAQPSWARSKLSLDHVAEVPVGERILVIPGELYCDARLLAALIQRNTTTDLPCENSARMPQLLVRGSPHENFDLAMIDPYISGIRRTLPPRCFFPDDIERAEELVLNSAQKGTLDIPAIVHAPIETWIVRHLCRTPVTPNQVTAFSTLLAIAATLFFARGWFWTGAISAAVFGLLDGVDGKLARVKVETTEVGKWEHELDYLLENAWWIAIAYALSRSAELPHAWLFALLLIGGDLLGKIATRPVMTHTGKPSHDFSAFERRLRLVGGRRNIYVWLLLIGLALAHFPLMFAFAGCWSVITAFIQSVRAVYICNFTPRQQALRA